MNSIGEILAARTGRRRETILRTVQDVATGDVASVAAVVDRWLRSKAAQFDVAAEATPSLLRTASIERDSFALSTIHEGDAYAARLSHVDPFADGTHWYVSIGVAPTGTESFSFDLTLEAEVPLHGSAPRSVPNVLKRLASDVGLRDAERTIEDRATRYIGEIGFNAFENLVRSASRRLPVVLLTPPFALDDLVLARLLCATAHVATMDSETTWFLTGRFGEGFRTFDGAVRVFVPGFSLDDDPRAHPRWTRPTIESVGRRDAQGGFRAVLTRDVFAAVTAHVAEVPVLNVDALDLRRYRRTQAATITETDTVPLVEGEITNTPEAPPDAAPTTAPEQTPTATVSPEAMDDGGRDVAAILRSQEDTIERQRREAAELQSENAAITQMYLDVEARYLALSEGSSLGVNLAALQRIGSEVPEAEAIVAAIGDLTRALTTLVESARNAQAVRSDLQRERARSAWLQSRIDAFTSRDASAGDPLPTYDDPNGLARWIAARYDGRMAVHARALTSWTRGAYEDRERLVGALDLLGNEYHAMRTRDVSSPLAFERYNERREALGLRESGAISDSEFGQYRDAYEVEYDGAPRRIDLHLRNMGNSTDPKRCLAVYFFWDDVRRIVVLCSLPGHLPNRLSP